jgi:hypothetical protein
MSKICPCTECPPGLCADIQLVNEIRRRGAELAKLPNAFRPPPVPSVSLSSAAERMRQAPREATRPIVVEREETPVPAPVKQAAPQPMNAFDLGALINEEMNKL